MLEDPTVIAAIIMAAAAIVAALIPILIRHRKRKLEDGSGVGRGDPNAGSIQVMTDGDQSLGIVQGNFVINQTIVHEYKESKKKHWRKLSVGNWPFQSEIPKPQGLWLHDVCEALQIAFAERYQNFTFLLSLTDKESEGVQLKLFQIISHKARFAAALKDLREAHLRKIFAAPEAADWDSARSKLYKKIINEADPLESWNVKAKIAMRDDLVAVRCIYEPEFKRIQLESLSGHSLDPGEYPEHLSCTSECLIFVATTLRNESAYIGDIRWYADDYRLQKMIVDQMDKGTIDISRLRVNTEDDEDWDYVNPEYDAEIRGYSK